MRLGRATALLAGLLWLMGTLSCERPEEPREATRASLEAEAEIRATSNSRPSIVLVVICSLRYAHLGFAGYERETTPFIDSVVNRGVLFPNAVSAASWTKPAVSSILTGLTPNVHGMTDFYKVREIQAQGFSPKRSLADEITTLAELLSGAGYATIACNNNPHAGRFFNLMQGFDAVTDMEPFHETGEMLETFERWLKDIDLEQPFFLSFLTRDAHLPFHPQYEYYARFSENPMAENTYPRQSGALKDRVLRLDQLGAPIPEEDQRRWIDLYDGELAQLDNALAELPRILERIGRASTTVVVVTADHGERLFDPHGAISHGGGFLEEHLIHIPLALYGPGIPKGLRIGEVVRSIDLYPTLAELANVDPPDVVQGRSLLPLIRGSRELPELSAFASHEETDHVLRRGRYKLHHRADGSRQLFDLATDPQELKDLLPSQAGRAEELHSELDRWLIGEAARRNLVAQGEVHELTPQILEQLRQLGYVD